MLQWAWRALLLCLGTAPARSSLGHGARSYFARAWCSLRRQLGTGPLMPHLGKALPLTLLLGPGLILIPLGRWRLSYLARCPLMSCLGTAPTRALLWHSAHSGGNGPGALHTSLEKHAHSYLGLTSTSTHSSLTQVRLSLRNA